MRAEVQHYPGGDTEPLGDPTVDDLLLRLDAMSRERGSTLIGMPDAAEYPQLLMTIDAGRFAASVIVEKAGPSEFEFFDRIGDPAATGRTDLVIGGQMTEGVPLRLVLSRQQAGEALAEFVLAPPESWVPNSQWQKQPESWI